METWLPAFMFVALLLCLGAGIPVAFCLAGVGIAFAAIGDAMGLIHMDRHIFQQIPRNIFEKITKGEILMAVPMFVLMGLILERARIADDLLTTMERAVRRLPGGLALAVIGVGALLAASTGIVGATVVTMTVLSLPSMLRSGYDRGLACGTIAASGTLGQIIPPSIVLLLLADQMELSPGQVFRAAFTPGLLLVAAYMLYVFIRVWRQPNLAPRCEDATPIQIRELVLGLTPPLLLITIVLGSIFTGLATPTEAAGCGVLGALIIALVRNSLTKANPESQRFDWRALWSACTETARINAMVFIILAGAQVFGLVFQRLDGDDRITELVASWQLDGSALLLAMMLLVFVLGFFLDFLEICFVIVPLLLASLKGSSYGEGEQLVFVSILLALNLQTSFLTPPFGFSLFYLKGSAPPEIKTTDIYRGVLPFVGIQIGVIVLVWLFPDLVLWLPRLVNQ